jgi:hypothetical protein
MLGRFQISLHLQKNWMGPNGETAIVPKDEGAGIMISAFQSREFGFGLNMREKELPLVNEYCKDKKYQDKEVLKAKQGDAKKKTLTKRLFILEFEYGASGEGYWVHEHIVLQLEDCIDCQKVLYPEQEFLFLLDHSCGHDRQRDDGLNVENMNKSYMSNKQKMRKTTIQCKKGYLGPYRRQLQPGDVLRMVFTPADVGPFWKVMKSKKNGATM